MLARKGDTWRRGIDVLNVLFTGACFQTHMTNKAGECEEEETIFLKFANKKVLNRR